MMTPVFTYSGGGINPLYDNEVGEDCVGLYGGASLAKGTVLGHVTGTGTAVNEVQTVTVTGVPTGGTFTLFFGGLVIGPIAYNATAAQVAAAVNAVLGTNVVLGGGGPLPGTAVTLTFQNDAAGVAMVAMTTASNLTGGTTPAVAVTRSTPGMPANGYWTAYNSGNTDGSQVARKILKFDTFVNQFGFVTLGNIDMTAFAGAANRAIPTYYKGYFRCSDLVGLDANAITNNLGKLTNATTFNDPGGAAVLCLTGA